MGGHGRGLIAAAWLLLGCQPAAPPPAPAPPAAPQAGWLPERHVDLNGQPPHLRVDGDVLWIADPSAPTELRLDSGARRPAEAPPPPRLSTGERVDAAISSVPLLVFTADGPPRRVGIPRLPKARTARVLGVSPDDRIWLLLSPDPQSAPRDLALVDPRGRILERARLPAAPPPTGAAAPGKGSEPAWAVFDDGRLVGAWSDGDRVAVRTYTPGLGADLVRAP